MNEGNVMRGLVAASCIAGAIWTVVAAVVWGFVL